MGILKQTSFLLAVTNFCCNAFQSWSKPTILEKMQSIKDIWITKMYNIVQLGCLFSKLQILFLDFSSTIGGIFYREVCIFFLILHNGRIQSIEKWQMTSHCHVCKRVHPRRLKMVFGPAKLWVLSNFAYNENLVVTCMLDPGCSK